MKIKADYANAPQWKETTIKSSLPKELKCLDEIAHNMWWAWNYEGRDLFKSLDPDLYEKCNANPVLLLERLSYDRKEAIVKDKETMAKVKNVYKMFREYMDVKPNSKRPSVAYFCMEYGINQVVKIYSGGLGMLAGDYMKEASDSNVDMCGVGFLYRYGYFKQSLSMDGQQIANYDAQNFNSLPLERVLDENGNLAIDDGFRDAVNMWKELHDKGYNPENSKLKDLRNLFALGQLAMYYDQSWGFNGVKSINPDAADFIASAAPLKGGNGEGASVLQAGTLMVMDNGDARKAATAKLVDYIMSEEKISQYFEDVTPAYPSRQSMEDLAVVYRFVMESSEDGRASILVTNNLMDRMGVSHEQLRADALENSPEIRPVVIMGMNEVMKEMIDPEVYEMFGIPDDAEETMYVATVPDKNSGAGVIAYQDFMDQAAERVGGDFFVLPSSINEILLVPDNGDMTADALRDMVKDVNAKEVSPEERLSDNVYHYDSKDHVFELAEKFEARQQEKKTEIDEKSEEKGSVLKDLKDKQKEAAAKPPVKDAAEKAAKSKGREVL